MTAIALELDEKMKHLDSKSAESLERLVRDALHSVETKNGGGTTQLSHDFFKKVAEEFGPDPLERPPQGEFEKREAW